MTLTRQTLVSYLDQISDARLAVGIARRSKDPVDIVTTLTDVEHILSRLALDVARARDQFRPSIKQPISL